jgi:hypothetical protein
MKPSDDPKADELRNSNISQSAEEVAAMQNAPTGEEVEPTDESYDTAGESNLGDTPISALMGNY